MQSYFISSSTCTLHRTVKNERLKQCRLFLVIHEVLFFSISNVYFEWKVHTTNELFFPLLFNVVTWFNSISVTDVSSRSSHIGFQGCFNVSLWVDIIWVLGIGMQMGVCFELIFLQLIWFWAHKLTIKLMSTVLETFMLFDRSINKRV